MKHMLRILGLFAFVSIAVSSSVDTATATCCQCTQWKGYCYDHACTGGLNATRYCSEGMDNQDECANWCNMNETACPGIIGSCGYDVLKVWDSSDDMECGMDNTCHVVNMGD